MNGKSDVSRVARWYLFKPKITILVDLGRPWNGKLWYISPPCEIFCSDLLYVISI
jgi:hypothetical protein